MLEASGTRVAIDRATGQLASVERDGRHVSLANGPRIVEGTATLTSLTHRPDGDGYVVEAAYEGNLKQVRWRMDGSGWLELSYRYENPGRHAHLGVTFDYPEAQVTGLRWLGRGPYRVWKNRMPGNRLRRLAEGLQRHRAPARTGPIRSSRATTPTSTGRCSQTKELPITVVTDTEDLFLRVLTPRYGVNPTFTAVQFPEGDLSFLHAIAPIGTKFAGPETMGPEGQLERIRGRPSPAEHGRLRGPPLLPLRRGPCSSGQLQRWPCHSEEPRLAAGDECHSAGVGAPEESAVSSPSRPARTGPLYFVTGSRSSTSPAADMSPLNTCIAGMAGV